MGEFYVFDTLGNGTLDILSGHRVVANVSDWTSPRELCEILQKEFENLNKNIDLLGTGTQVAVKLVKDIELLEAEIERLGTDLAYETGRADRATQALSETQAEIERLQAENAKLLNRATELVDERNLLRQMAHTAWDVIAMDTDNPLGESDNFLRNYDVWNKEYYQDADKTLLEAKEQG